MKLLLIGYGKMGRMVDAMAAEEGLEVAGRIDVDNVAGEWPAADVAIDFTTPGAVPGNLARLAHTGTPAVIGTTGWASREAELKAIASQAGLGVVASANFSVGVNLFQLLVADAARLMAARPEYEAWIYEMHHSAKLDAPSGTALLLKEAMAGAGFDRSIDIASTRAGKIPGTHTIGFDSPSDTIELTHIARDRRGFARGALVAARWVVGRRGWYSMTDVLGGASTT